MKCPLAICAQREVASDIKSVAGNASQTTKRLRMAVAPNSEEAALATEIPSQDQREDGQDGVEDGGHEKAEQGGSMPIKGRPGVAKSREVSGDEGKPKPRIVCAPERFRR